GGKLHDHGRCHGNSGTRGFRCAEIARVVLRVAMVRCLHEGKSRKTGVRAVIRERSRALLAALFQHAAMEGPENKIEHALVPWVRVRAHGAARPLAGVAGPGHGPSSGLGWRPR